MLCDILARHPGPYRLCLTRPSGKLGLTRSQWLPRAFPSDEIEDKAIRILSCARTAVVNVGVWSEREQLFATVICGGQDL